MTMSDKIPQGLPQREHTKNDQPPRGLPGLRSKRSDNAELQPVSSRTKTGKHGYVR